MPPVSLDPLFAWPVAALGAVLALVAVVVGALGPGRLGWLTSARRAVLVGLAALLMLGPHAGEASTTVTGIPDFEVVVALDRTASMGVRDAETGSRIEQAVDDVVRLAAELDAPVTVVTWGGIVQQRVPATTDDAHLTRAVRTVAPEPPATGSGSRVDRPVIALRDVLARAAAEHPGRAMVLLLLSDGENTAGGRQQSFSPLAEDLDRALVVGYGTPAGGPVPLAPDRPSAYVPDVDGTGPAVSRRDDANLREVAAEVGGEYRDREDLPTVTDVRDLLLPGSTAQKISLAPASISWIVALALLLLLVPDLRLFTTQWREVRAMRRLR